MLNKFKSSRKQAFQSLCDKGMVSIPKLERAGYTVSLKGGSVTAKARKSKAIIHCPLFNPDAAIVVLAK